MSGHIVLVGLSGSGKSAAGRRLSTVLARPLYDTDVLLAARAGQAVPDLLRADAARFRALEEEVVAKACAAPAGVIATGGGVILSPRNRAALARDNHVVWLRASVPTLLARLRGGEERPLLAGDAAARLGALATERAPLYAACATMVVDVGNATIEECAARIVADLGLGARVGEAKVWS